MNSKALGRLCRARVFRATSSRLLLTSPVRASPRPALLCRYFGDEKYPWPERDYSDDRDFGEEHPAAKLKMPELDLDIHTVLNDKLDASLVDLSDQSGGCGTFYKVSVASDMFEGLSPVKRHRLVTDALADIIPKLHGITIKTWTTPEYMKALEDGTAIELNMNPGKKK